MSDASPDGDRRMIVAAAGGNPIPDTIENDGTGTARFTAVAQHAHELGPENPKVQELIRFLKAHRTVLDPTMGIFQSLFSGDPAALTPGLEGVVPRIANWARDSLTRSEPFPGYNAKLFCCSRKAACR